MSRRQIIAAPAAPALGVMPALAEVEPPIEGLFARWEAAIVAYNASDEIDDETDHRLEDAIRAIESEILAITPRTVREYAFKVMVLHDFVSLDGVPWGAGALAEARALASAGLK